MITLDLDLNLLSRYYNISSHSFEEYQNMSITQIMKAEAEKGNTQAADFLMNITTNPKELAEIFQLVNPKNRFLILINMNQEDLLEMMEYLQPQELVLGLSVFDKDGILKLMLNLEPETFEKLILENMKIDKFLKSLNDEYMNEFLSSDKINRDLIMKAIEYVDEEELQKMMESFLGESCYDDKETILENLNKFDDDAFGKAIFGFEKRGKQQLIFNILKEKPELFQEFSPEAMLQPFVSMGKDDILKSLTVLKTDELLPMVSNLQHDITALIATQINPEMMAKVLCKDFKDIIASCGIAS